VENNVENLLKTQFSPNIIKKSLEKQYLKIISWILFFIPCFLPMVSLEDIKLPPHNIDAEKATLCGILMDNELMYVCDGLGFQSEDFYLKEHASIFKAIKTLWLARKAVDVLTVSDQLVKD
jgi:hypothetical protein